MEEDTITRSIRINASAERVWSCITQPENIKQWYAFGGAEVDLRVDGKISFSWDEHGKYLGVIEAVEPLHTFAFRFVPDTADIEPKLGNSTRVEFVLAPKDDGVGLSFTESGYLSLDLSPEERVQQKSMNEGAWDDSLKLLTELAEKVA